MLIYYLCVFCLWFISQTQALQGQGIYSNSLLAEALSRGEPETQLSRVAGPVNVDSSCGSEYSTPPCSPGDEHHQSFASVQRSRASAAAVHAGDVDTDTGLTAVCLVSVLSLTSASWAFWHCSHSRWTRVCETVRHPSVCLSVRSIVWPPHTTAGGLLLCPAVRRYWSIAARRALSSICEQCHVVSWHVVHWCRKLNTDCLNNYWMIRLAMLLVCRLHIAVTFVPILDKISCCEDSWSII